MYALFIFIKQWFSYINYLKQVIFLSDHAKDLEILSLRTQLAEYQEKIINKKIRKPHTSLAFKSFWVLLSKFYKNWKDNLIMVSPETVIKWHRYWYKKFWTRKSKRVGRPRLSKDIIKRINTIHKENPNMSAEKISELLESLGISDAPCGNTIRKYLPEIKNDPTEKQIQSWITFLNNHKGEIWAMDFFVVPTIKFKMIFVLIVINHESRKIEHFNVTTNPNLQWVKQQIRTSTPYDHKPKYLIHDNDKVFTCEGFQDFLTDSNIKSKRTSYRSPWQNGIAERVNGIIRQELIKYIIPFSESHLYRLLDDYINNYYNTHRTHQGINCKTPIPLPKYESTTLNNSNLVATPILNGLYHTYEKVA